MNGLVIADFSFHVLGPATTRSRTRASKLPGMAVNLACTVPRRGANALLTPVDAPHRLAAYRVVDSVLDPRVIAQITDDIHYGNENLTATGYLVPSILDVPMIVSTRPYGRRLYRSTEASPVLERRRTWRA
jgi:putrescine transport system substrate-binding protein